MQQEAHFRLFLHFPLMQFVLGVTNGITNEQIYALRDTHLCGSVPFGQFVESKRVQYGH